MCLLFFQINRQAKEDEYKLILVNGRDEMYNRPAKPVSWWSPDTPDVIGGQDIMPGRAGGTWLAMNRSNGRIGVLLNILQPKDEIIADKLGRGFIVTDFLLGEKDHRQYTTDLSTRGEAFNGFQTIALEVKGERAEGTYYSNFVYKPPIPLGDGIHSFGNSLNPYDPWPKVTYGRKRFSAVVNNNGTTKTKELLIDDLFDMMADKTMLPVDSQMIRQGGSGRLDVFISRLSSLCVDMPDVMYGSRTWTVILVDGQDNVDYIEKNYEEPIICDPKTGISSPTVVRRFNFAM